MQSLFKNHFFIIGLLIRILFILMVVPNTVSDWFGPFISTSVNSFSLDPWSQWLGSGGATEAFPYGYAMWLYFLPFALLCKQLALPIFFAYSIALLFADLALFYLLKHIHQARTNLLLMVYWLSPIVLLSSYFFGVNDIVPVLLLSFSLFSLERKKWIWSGFLLISAASAKLSMILALPFYVIYMARNRSIRQFFKPFCGGVIIALLLWVLPFAFSSAAIDMLFNNPEMQKIFQLQLTLGSYQIYLVPLSYFVLVYLSWRVQRLNFELFYACLGICFLLLVVLTPASPGWFMWAIPMLVSYQLNKGRIAIVLVALFSGLYVVSSLLFMPWGLDQIGLQNWYLLMQKQGLLDGHIVSIVHTGIVSLGLVLVFRIWQETVSNNDFFRLSRRPLVIGVAGDSGAGKDTYSDVIEGLFGSHSVFALRGDNYHLWDRQKSMWQVMTHLNPMANDLQGLAGDLTMLLDSKPIITRNYDHSTGKMSQIVRMKSNNIIIVNGLHALYLPAIRKIYDISIYLDMDEKLRRYLKIQRDVNERGHSLDHVMKSIDSRAADAQKFVCPQKEYADLIFSVMPINQEALTGAPEIKAVKLKLKVRTLNPSYDINLRRTLVGVLGLHVETTILQDSNVEEMLVEGDVTAEDISLAASIVCPKVIEFLDVYPKWSDGVLGLMQLFTLAHLNQVFKQRFVE